MLPLSQLSYTPTCAEQVHSEIVERRNPTQLKFQAVPHGSLITQRVINPQAPAPNGGNIIAQTAAPNDFFVEKPNAFES